MKGKSLSHVRLLVTPWTEAHQAPPSMGFSRLHLESRTPSWAGLWTLSYTPNIYRNDIPTGKPGPRKEEPQASPSPKKTPNYLCNRIESYILLCLLGYDHKPIDKVYESWVNFDCIFLFPLFRLVSGNFGEVGLGMYA